MGENYSNSSSPTALASRLERIRTRVEDLARQRDQAVAALETVEPPQEPTPNVPNNRKLNTTGASAVSNWNSEIDAILGTGDDEGQPDEGLDRLLADEELSKQERPAEEAETEGDSILAMLGNVLGGGETPPDAEEIVEAHPSIGAIEEESTEEIDLGDLLGEYEGDSLVQPPTPVLEEEPEPALEGIPDSPVAEAVPAPAGSSPRAESIFGRIQTIRQLVDSLEQERNLLRKKNEELRAENTTLRNAAEENATLRNENQKVTARYEALLAETSSMRSEYETLTSQLREAETCLDQIENLLTWPEKE